MADSKLHHLIALAEEPSSERRRELLREVTDLFFTVDGGPAGSEMGLFDDVLTQLAGEMEEAVRAELAQRMATAPAAPSRLVSGFATDAIAVATPILSTPGLLSDEDQLRVARTKGEEHLRALSRRHTLRGASGLIAPAVSYVTPMALKRARRRRLGQAP